VRRLTPVSVIAGAVLSVSLSVAGCARNGGIGAGNAYIPVPVTPGTSVAYVDIRNNGAADELVGARISVGGTVALRAPVMNGAQLSTMRSVSEIPIPADSTVKLDPRGYHLLITGAGPLVGGKAVTLTLVFAHGGPVTVTALVTNPQSGGTSYFLN
jgi:periplasmic copper chaperone A